MIRAVINRLIFRATPAFQAFWPYPVCSQISGIIAETGFDALAPGKMLSGNEQGLDIEEGELEAEGLQRGEQDRCDLMFDVAGIETGIAHHLYALGRNVGDQERDEIQSGARHRLAGWVVERPGRKGLILKGR